VSSFTARSIRRGRLLISCLLVAWHVSANTDPGTAAALDRAEQLSWMDGPAALRLLDQLEPRARSGEALIQWLMARGLAYADGEPEQAQAIVQRLYELGRTQSAALAAGHIIKAYLYLHGDQSDRADAELQRVGAQDRLPAFERFRLEEVRGYAHMLRGRNEAALPFFEHARDIANAMHSQPRVIESLIRLGGFYTTIRNLDRAARLVAQMRTIAQQTGDDLLWAEVGALENEIADARGDRPAQGRALLEALTHARRGGSERSLAMVLVDLGSLDLETGDYGADRPGSPGERQAHRGGCDTGIPGQR
jgi:tetratricopeptide (TPR) repeat protein